MKKDLDNIKELFSACKQERENHTSTWQAISKHVSISVDSVYFDNGGNVNSSRDLDQFVEDPTAALAVFQSGDYLNGIMWGNGSESFRLEPSEDLLDITTSDEVGDYFTYVTKKILSQMNHDQSGLNSALKSYFYDQSAFGTSGIGCFKNADFLNGSSSNALIFRDYGVDNMAIDEGRNGLIEYIFVVHNWRTNRIVNEFAVKDGEISTELLAKLPKQIQEAYNNNDANKTFSIIQAVIPREDYNPKLKGKRGTKYEGVFFLDGSEDEVFYREDYKTRPINVCRQIKVRGEVYGRSAGTMLISSIRAVNYMVGKTIEILEKMASPALAITSNALVGDSVLDTSSDSLTVLNEQASGSSKNPIAPLYDVGDPTGIVQYLIPYLNEKIATGFKVDLLLDLNSSKDMTASESTQRFIIRGQSLSPMVMQQAIEVFIPMIDRAIDVLLGLDMLGINPQQNPELIETLTKNNATNRIIPDAVLEFMKQGKPWYNIILSDKVRKLMNTERLEAMMQFMNGLMIAAQVNPITIHAVKIYKLMEDISKELGVDLLIGEEEFNAIVAQANQAQAQMQQAQALNLGSQSGKNIAEAGKAQIDATR